MLFRSAVTVRARRSAEQTALYTAEFAYSGDRHPLRDWAVNDGALLREELAAATDELAQQIVERVFLIYSRPDSPAQQRVLPWPPPRPD